MNIEKVFEENYKLQVISSKRNKMTKQLLIMGVVSSILGLFRRKKILKKVICTNKILTIVLTLCFSTFVCAQEGKHPKKIIQSIDDTIRSIKEFNPDGLLIFEKEIQYWKDTSVHLFIDGYLYNGNQVVHEYHATEDFLRLIRYEYDSITGLKNQFVKHTGQKSVNNEILYSIENRDQLISLVESVIPIDSKLANILDSNESHTLVKKGRTEIYSRYQNNSETVRITKKFDKRENLIFLEEQNNYQTTTEKLKYNKRNQLIKRTFGFDDYLSETEYFYSKEFLTNTITEYKSGETSSCEYFYSNDALIKEVVHKKEGDITYEYSYEYFD